MIATIVNFFTILIGAAIGLLLKNGLSERYKETLMTALSLSVMLIGLKMAWQTQNALIVVISMAVGAVIGEALKLEDYLNKFGEYLTMKLGKRFGNVGEGFVYASLVFCIGAMAIVGSLQAGLTGDGSTIYAKAMIDGAAAVVFSAAMGVGVALAAFPVLIYQGAITLGAGLLSGILSESAINELTAVGGLIVFAIGLSMIKIKTIRIASFLPAIPIAVGLVMLEIF